MDTQNKYCVNCKQGWTEITPENVDEIRKNKRQIVIMNTKEWIVPKMSYGISKMTLVLYSEWGGYYYYVLPGLKLNNEQAGTNQII